jgi:hypothetical protein
MKRIKVRRLKTGATEGPSLLDVAVVVLSPVLAALLTVVFLLGWWVQAAGQWLTREKGGVDE